MPDEELEFPFEVCRVNMIEIGKISQELKDFREDTLNHLSEIKKNNKWSKTQKTALYTTAIGGLIAIIELLITKLL